MTLQNKKGLNYEKVLLWVSYGGKFYWLTLSRSSDGPRDAAAAAVAVAGNGGGVQQQLIRRRRCVFAAVVRESAVPPLAAAGPPAVMGREIAGRRGWESG